MRNKAFTDLILHLIIIKRRKSDPQALLVTIGCQRELHGRRLSSISQCLYPPFDYSGLQRKLRAGSHEMSKVLAGDEYSVVFNGLSPIEDRAKERHCLSWQASQFVLFGCCSRLFVVSSLLAILEL